MEVNVNVMMEKEVVEKLKEVAEEQQRTVSGQIRWIIDRWLEREK